MRSGVLPHWIREKEAKTVTCTVLVLTWLQHLGINIRPKDRVSGVGWAVQLMVIFQQPWNSTCLLYPADGGGTLGNLDRGSPRRAVSGCSYLGEESCGWYFRHTLLTSLSDQGKALPFLWVWSFGILDMVMCTSTKHIYSGLHQASVGNIYNFKINNNAMLFNLEDECKEYIMKFILHLPFIIKFSSKS